MAAEETRPPHTTVPIVPDSLLNKLSIGVFLVFAALYLATLCPTVYWGDSAEYIITSFTLRNAHPTGYPLYSLAGKAATLLPLGSIAFRVNLLSAVLGAATLLLSFRLMVRLSGGWVLPLTAAASIGVSRTFWNLSTIAETLTLNLFLVALLFSLILAKNDAGRANWAAVAFLGGLACTNHFQALIVLPGIALIFSERHPRWKQARLRVPALALFFIAGLSLYAYLVIRSGYPYPNVYPDANTAWGFFSYYIGRTAFLGPERLRGWGEVLGLLPQAIASIPREIGWPLSLLAIPGLGFLWRSSRAAALAMASVVVLTMASAVFNGPTRTTYKMFLYSAQAYWALALLGCLGGAWLVGKLGDTAASRRLRPAVPVLVLGAALLLLRGNSRYNDLSSHDWASRYAETELTLLPPGAVYLPGKDNPINLTTYWRFVKGYRRDLALIPQEGLMSGYFLRRIKAMYPDLDLGNSDSSGNRFGRGGLGDFVEVASFFRDLAAKHPDRAVVVYPDIPEEDLEGPRTMWGDNYRILPPNRRTDEAPPPAAAWDAFERDFSLRAAPFLFDDYVIPDMANIHQRFGWHLLREGHADRAVQEYRRSVAILPASSSLRFNLARILHKLGRLGEAARELDLILERDPGNRPAGLLLARVRLAAGDAAGASKLLDAFRKGADPAEVFAVSGEMALINGDPAGAAANLRLALEAAPGNTDYLLVYGRALYSDRRFEDLLAVGSRLVESGERFDGWYAQGLALAALNRLSEAERSYREALLVRPEAFQVFNNLGVVFLVQGRKEEAAESFRRSLAINPGYEPARQNLQRLLR